VLGLGAVAAVRKARRLVRLVQNLSEKAVCLRSRAAQGPLECLTRAEVEEIMSATGD
jgi:hypothetical protein